MRPYLKRLTLRFVPVWTQHPVPSHRDNNKVHDSNRVYVALAVIWLLIWLDKRTCSKNKLWPLLQPSLTTMPLLVNTTCFCLNVYWDLVHRNTVMARLIISLPFLLLTRITTTPFVGRLISISVQESFWRHFFHGCHEFIAIDLKLGLYETIASISLAVPPWWDLVFRVTNRSSDQHSTASFNISYIGKILESRPFPPRHIFKQSKEKKQWAIPHQNPPSTQQNNQQPNHQHHPPTLHQLQRNPTP